MKYIRKEVMVKHENHFLMIFMWRRFFGFGPLITISLGTVDGEIHIMARNGPHPNKQEFECITKDFKKELIT